MAFAQIHVACRQLPFDDVLHPDCRVDAHLLLEDAFRRVHRVRRRRRGGGLFRHALGPAFDDDRHGGGCRRLFCDLLVRASKGRRKNHKGHDDLPARDYGGFGHSLTHAFRRERGPFAFTCSRISRSFRAAALWTRFLTQWVRHFFTLSIGMGSIAIFGSYIDKKRSLPGEALRITLLDTGVALIAGLIIFPACFTFGVNPDSGPNLIFITLPNVFISIPGGRIWGTLFFIFLLFAALSTVIAVFENILAWWMDLKGWSRKKAVIINGFLILVLSVPCVLGFNVLSGVQPLGEGSTIMDLEDFIVSNNILPLGSLVYLVFCTSRYGWGWKNFRKEANTGEGLKFPNWIRVYVSYILPIIVLAIFIQGYIAKFFPQLIGG